MNLSDSQPKEVLTFYLNKEYLDCFEMMKHFVWKMQEVLLILEELNIKNKSCATNNHSDASFLFTILVHCTFMLEEAKNSVA